MFNNTNMATMQNSELNLTNLTALEPVLAETKQTVYCTAKYGDPA
jgi:hypothetical protein